MAHSAHPELGESAIEKLLDALDAIRRMPLPEDPILGRTTINIGTISVGTRAEHYSRRSQSGIGHSTGGRRT